jgi:hypothetical protein
MFRSQVSDARWSEMVTPVRQPLGAVAARMFESVSKTRTLPGAPDGDYEVLTFKTSFATRPNAVETVILTREGAAWRVAGYFIR